MKRKPGAFAPEPGPAPEALLARVAERVRSRPVGVPRLGGLERAFATFDLPGREGE